MKDCMTIKTVITKLGVILGYIRWNAGAQLTEDQLQEIKALINTGSYVILTGRTAHLSTYFVTFANWVLTGRSYRWGHALVNFPKETELTTVGEASFLEALVAKGVTYSPFQSVFKDVQKVALLTPVNITPIEWRIALATADRDVGRPYDSSFNFKSPDKMSCTELIMHIMQAVPSAEEKFPDLTRLLKKKKNITPPMFYSTPDFKIVRSFSAPKK